VGSDASGNVGIGVTPESSWDANITVLRIGPQTVIRSGDTDYSDATFIATNVKQLAGVNTYIQTDTASQYSQQGGKHYFSVAPSGTADSAISWTTAMTVDNSGAVLINRTGTTYSERLSINGGTAGYAVHTVKDSTGAQGHFVFSNPNGAVGTIFTNGTSTSYNTSSDYRLKENVTPMSGSIDRLKQLKPSRFNFIADADKTVDGFLAHEAQAIVPECATGEKDGMKMEEYEVTPAVMDGETVVTEAVMGEREVPDMQGIDQSKLVPLLVGAIQELTARLEALEAN
jgi:hypothetical protein